MRSGIVRVLVMLATIAMAGCGAESSNAADGGAPSAAYAPGQRGVLRVRQDGARGRTWVLALDGVRVYDTASNKLLRRIVLPNWDVAGLVCRPDMILDPSGSVVVSANVRPKLWRIDADTFRVNERDVTLQDREQWDLGFGGLMLAADGSLFALTSTGGWLWNVDLKSGRGRLWNWGLPILNVCELAPIE